MAQDQGPNSLPGQGQPMALKGEVYDAKTVREAYHMVRMLFTSSHADIKYAPIAALYHMWSGVVCHIPAPLMGATAIQASWSMCALVQECQLQ